MEDNDRAKNKADKKGFNSLFLYRRWYRCFTRLDAFSVENGNIERRKDLSEQEFQSEYDGQKPYGEIAPTLLKDYTVPHLFREDFFDVLDRDKRPPFRWLIIGPE
ncbi:F-box protein [Acorus gramineus]|uniref:F-box protein n=1 Tax=Acorus gramineus TaxID=55184 RepID=A0AAV9A103_ACOGR|nr:F-box protein [Acorus gramineus]